MIRLESVLKTPLQDVLKMSWRHLEDFFKTCRRRLEDVLKTFLQDVLKTSWRRFEDILARLLEDVLKTSWRRMNKTNILVLIKTSSRRLEDVFWRRMSIGNMFVLIKTSWRRLEDVFWTRRRKTSSSRRMFAGVMHGWLFKDIDYAKLEVLTMLVNDPLKRNNVINTFFINT